MKAASVLALCASFGAAGCLGTRPEPPPPPPDPACLAPGAHFILLETDTRIYRQGADVRVTPKANVAPGGTIEIPLRCTSNWSVTGPARLSEDRRTASIDPDAPPGAIVSVGFDHVRGRVDSRFQVIGRDEVVLTGARAQQGIEGCGVTERIGELEFGIGNRFSVTFMPFETYRDYWGTYTFDAATGRLRLQVEGGNFVPSGLDLEGQAELSSGRLVLRDMFLGSRQGAVPQGSCTYRF